MQLKGFARPIACYRLDGLSSMDAVEAAEGPLSAIIRLGPHVSVNFPDTSHSRSDRRIALHRARTPTPDAKRLGFPDGDASRGRSGFESRKAERQIFDQQGTFRLAVSYISPAPFTPWARHLLPAPHPSRRGDFFAFLQAQSRLAVSGPYPICRRPLLRGRAKFSPRQGCPSKTIGM